MPLPIVIPIIPLLKIVALGSIKTIFLAVGACFFPRLTLRLILGSATSLIIPVIAWLKDAGEIEDAPYFDLVANLRRLGQHNYSAKEARTILFMLTRKSMISVRNAIISLPGSTLTWCRQLLRRLTKSPSG